MVTVCSSFLSSLGSLEKYLDDFLSQWQENVSKVWCVCVCVCGCPTGPDDTAEDIVEFIARGQIKTVALYDAYPSLSRNQIHTPADWYVKTQRFQRAVAKGDGNLEDIGRRFLQGAGHISRHT